MAAKDKPADADQAPPEPAPEPAEQLGPYHGLEPVWIREALTGILERLAKLERGK
jgi:hypothetical protein